MLELTGIDILSGTVEIAIAFMGVDIFSKTEDLCAKAACPIKAGPAVITLVEALPPIAPPVRLGVAWSGVPYSTVLEWPYTICWSLYCGGVGVSRSPCVCGSAP